MRYLVTGGSGLVGRFLIPELQARGHGVTNFDLVYGQNVSDKAEVKGYLSTVKPDIVIHLAAQSGVEATRRSPLESLQLNVAGTWNVLEACRVAGVQNVVVASSNHIYGKLKPVSYLIRDDNITTEHSPQSMACSLPACDHARPRTARFTAMHHEGSRLDQLDLYSVSKTCADYITRAYAHNYGMNTVAVRNTNVYGPNDPHRDHIVPGTILSILQGKTPIIKSDGKTVKSYIYGADVATAYITISENCEKLKGQAINVVGCEPISVLALVQTICFQMGWLAPDASVEKVKGSIAIFGDPNDQADEYLDGSRMRSLGWEPSHTLELGLQKTIAWFKENT